uniref:Trafficking protein particle complex subunit 11 domain-containing protein n=1 Tax=Trypanosoma vivax (strain Y486) TaxID=1055687 RepID=G0U3G4_TRYVY|nr:conserved hypothetical protein, fragment [Trypanosoma vivax Y486]
MGAPTWLLPCTALRSQRCAPILWLPLSLCLECAKEEDETDTAIKISDVCYTRGRPSHGDEWELYDRMSGFERVLLRSVLQDPFVPMEALRGVFPAGASHYDRSAVLEVLVRIATDAASLAPSPWESMELHRGTVAVVVVLNCHEYEPRSAFRATKTIFQRYFKDSVCRCLVVDPTPTLLADMPKQGFIPTYTDTPVQEVARFLLKEVALATVQRFNATIIQIASTMETSSAIFKSVSRDLGNGDSNSFSNYIMSPVRGMRNDKNDKSCEEGGSKCASDEAASKQVAPHCIGKKKGDLLLVLGALDAALAAYVEAYNSSTEALWTSATLESIATLRFLQDAPLFEVRHGAEGLFSMLLSDGAAWTNEMEDTIRRIENVISRIIANQKRAVSLLKSNTHAPHLGKKLCKEVDEPLTQHCESIQRRLTAICEAFMPAKKELVSMERLHKHAERALTSFRNVMHLHFHELHLYLDTALEVLGTMGDRVVMQRREAIIRLKHVELYVQEGDKQGMLNSFTPLSKVLGHRNDTQLRNVREKMLYLCTLGGCWRKAILFTLEAAAAERKARANNAAIHLLLCASRIAGVPFHIIEYDVRIAEMHFSQQRLRITSSTHNERGSLQGENVHLDSAQQRPHNGQNVLLLKELLHAVTVAGLDADIRCTVASLLLFDYFSFLPAEQQKSLLSFVKKASAQPNSTLCVHPPLLYSIDVLALPTHLSPRTVPLSGAQFTFINSERSKMTVLTLNGKIISHGQVVWSVGTVGEMEVVLKNPFQQEILLSSIALSCHSAESLDGSGYDGVEMGKLSLTPSSLPPSAYVATNITLPARAKKKLRLQVQPNEQGFLVVNGVEVTFGDLASCRRFIMPPPVSDTSLHVKVVQESFCAEARGDSIFYPGDVRAMQIMVTCPTNGISTSRLQYIIFRTTAELAYDPPVAPPKVPSAVPVFAVIPRRIQETYLRVVVHPGIVVSSIKLSRNRRFVEIRVKNKNTAQAIQLLCSCMDFVNAPDALVVAGVEHCIPPIEVAKIPSDVKHFALPWKAVGRHGCNGFINLDFSNILDEVNGLELLEDAVVTVTALSHFTSGQSDATIRQWKSTEADQVDAVLATLPIMSPAQLRITVNVPWKQPVSLRVRLVMDGQHTDACVLSGVVDAVQLIGDADCFEEVVELLPLRSGEHVLAITLYAPGGWESMHCVRFHCD